MVTACFITSRGSPLPSGSSKHPRGIHSIWSGPCWLHRRTPHFWSSHWAELLVVGINFSRFLWLFYDIPHVLNCSSLLLPSHPCICLGNPSGLWLSPLWVYTATASLPATHLVLCPFMSHRSHLSPRHPHHKGLPQGMCEFFRGECRVCPVHSHSSVSGCGRVFGLTPEAWGFCCFVLYFFYWGE